MGNLYTVGHSRHPFALFLSWLQKYGIRYVLDVRSVPFSKFAETYNRDMLKILLSQQGISYFHMGKNFGARPGDTALYTKEKYLDFAKVRESKLFRDGVNNVISGLKQGNNIVLMCSERDPMDCHRAIMVSKGFQDAGVQVSHILEDGSLQTQQELESRMLKKYFPDRNQLSLFQQEERDEQDYIEECYRLRNAEIGYSLAEEGIL